MNFTKLTRQKKKQQQENAKWNYKTEKKTLLRTLSWISSKNWDNGFEYSHHKHINDETKSLEKTVNPIENVK